MRRELGVLHPDLLLRLHERHPDRYPVLLESVAGEPTVTLREAMALAADRGIVPGAMLPVLHALQDEFGFIPDEAIPVVAEALNVSRADAVGVISFYHDFPDAARETRAPRLPRRGLPGDGLRVARRPPLRPARRRTGWDDAGRRRHLRIRVLPGQLRPRAGGHTRRPSPGTILELDMVYGEKGRGQTKIKIEAFLAMLQNRGDKPPRQTPKAPMRSLAKSH